MKTSWNLTLLFKDKKEISKTRTIVEEKTKEFVQKWQDNKDYLKKPEILKQALDEYANWLTNYGANTKEMFYYHLWQSLDQENPQIKAEVNKATEFAIKIENQMQFFTHRISKVDKKSQSKFLKSKFLTPYKHFLEKLFESANYLLTEPEEKILNTLSPLAYNNWTRMLSSFLAKEEKNLKDESEKLKPRSFAEILNLMNSSKKSVRNSAAKAFNEILAKHAEVAENELNSVLQYKKITDELRGFKKPDEARHLADDIDSDVVKTLVETVSKNFDISQKYYLLKAKLMGVDKLAYHERNVPILLGKVNKKYDYEKASRLVKKVLENLDKEFLEIFVNFEENGQIDVFPKKGKANGAFATTQTLSTPTYILLNHTGEFDNVTTLAHELGHGINNELIRKRQNEINFGTPTSTAEVASTFFEDFVFQELIQDADQKTRLSLMMAKLNDYVSTIFRQIAFYNFELELHDIFRQKGYLSKEEIGQMFQKHMVSYMGKAVSQDPGSENWWIYVHHFRYFFYVYSYASGLLISKSLQASVKQNKKFIEKVKEFLSAGKSDSPKNIFAKLQIDITKKEFWEKGIKEIAELLTETEKLATDLSLI
ncbi:MAG: M3 family oligoendopeptidase [Patescibacteria group bacterium]|nr:M3 family oligoendopeptidase [Patescibacteria group bacterium]